MTETTDLVVVGAGPGGYAAAFDAADRGLSVTLVDASAQPGGVCLHRGCIPSKALLHAAKVLTDARDASRWGIGFGPPSIDLGALREWKTQIVGRLTGGLGRLAAQRSVRYVQGRAAFAGSHELAVTPVESGAEVPSRIAFEHAILATGSRPARPGPLALDDAPRARFHGSARPRAGPAVAARDRRGATSGSSWEPSTARSVRR